MNDQDILELVITKGQAQQLIRDINSVLTSKFTSTNIEAVLNETFSYSMKDKMLFLMKEQKIDFKDKKFVEELLLLIKKSVETLPVIQLIIAFEPKQELLTTISSWLVMHTKKVFLLDISVNSTIIGGAVITYEGKYKDYSVKKKLTGLYEKGDLNLTT